MVDAKADPDRAAARDAQEGLESGPGTPQVPADAAQPDMPIEHPSTTGGACSRISDPVSVRNGLRDFLDMIIVGGGFQEHEGHRIFVFTHEYSRMAPLGHGSALIQNGQFTLRFTDGYARFSYQPIFFYVDANGDGRCDEAAGDHPGYMPTSAYNPASNEPLMHGLQHRHDSTIRQERVCDRMNACLQP